MKPFFSIPYYHDYLSPNFAAKLLEQAKPVDGVAGLSHVGTQGETREALKFLQELYLAVHDDLALVLLRRAQDRKFLDERVRACHEFNKTLGRDLLDPDYKTVLGLEDAHGRIVIGPRTSNYHKAGGAPIAPLPEFLKGPHVTLFGPPDTAKLAINAMNAYHRKLPGEPAIVEELLSAQEAAPMWGADDEDSKTPLRADLVDAAQNLTACFEGTLTLTEGEKKYALAREHLALPIKRFPGLALPASFLFHGRSPIPLHLYDFALHLFRNWANPRALVFYVPKLENEEEAAYIHKMIAAAEARVQKLHPSYKLGTVRLMIVLENPRAILRAHEIMDALHPYFAGASLGWHDYLASTARLLKEDANYRIPVKADPNIVIKYIKASHLLLAEAVGSRGGIKVGGMYGILPVAGNKESLQVTLKGFFKDVITQMKRELTGFWVAHPDFVRLGLALVEAWKRYAAGDKGPLYDLVQALLDEKHHKELLTFIDGKDIEGLDPQDPNYVRSLIVADIKESDFIPNNHPDEIRYNVFQSLQYLTDWLSGNGCVALPTVIEGVPVRVMDDLATAERSRWEVWHELYHDRFPMEDFLRIAHEEMNFIRRDLSDAKKIVQVKWDERTAKWYPIAMRLMLKLMTGPRPSEFATELLMPFTVESVRSAPDPWAAVTAMDPEKYRLPRYVADYDRYFEICGVERFARAMAGNAVEDLGLAEEIIRSFAKEEVLAAAGFHGDIGQSRKTLDARSASEQSPALASEEATLLDLRSLGEEYRARFGFKFLVSARGKSGAELLAALKTRLQHGEKEELHNARLALWEISRKRLEEHPQRTKAKLHALLREHGIPGASIAVNYKGKTQALPLGESEKGKRHVAADTLFELASLSKTLGTAYALEYFGRRVPLETAVNEMFARTSSPFRLRAKTPEWAEQVTLEHLLSHRALGMHYVRGFSPDEELPPVEALLEGKHGYAPIEVIHEPGKRFSYSGGGFLVLEHLIEALEGKPIRQLTRSFLESFGALTFDHKTSGDAACGYFDSGDAVAGGRWNFPAFAAGALGPARDMARFLLELTEAYRNLGGSCGLSHDTAVRMLHGIDGSSREFMGCDMGLGVFVAEAGRNRIAIHQGANEGFRAIFLQCFAGPDAGKGLVVLANGDNRAVPFIATAVRELLAALELEGVDFARLAGFRLEGVPQEQSVNLGYKRLLFDAFLPDLPEAIEAKGPPDPLAKLNAVVGAEIVSVSNQRFARAENLLSEFLPAFDPELFGRQGKIMDSWESARHNQSGCDTLHLRLREPVPARFVSLSTKFHDGNQAEFVRLEGLDAVRRQWIEILPKTRLAGHALFRAELAPPTPPLTEVRVFMYPDGGLSRLGLYATLPPEAANDFQPLERAGCVRFPDPIPKTRKPLTIPYEPKAEEVHRNLERVESPDWASVAFGGAVLRASNEHYGPAVQVVSPYPPIHMFDGLESARSRAPGHSEELVVRLGKPFKIERVALDFTFFVNNNPLYVSLHGWDGSHWLEILAKTKVKAYAANRCEFRIEHPGVFPQLMVRTYPDGGINRVHIY